MAWEIHSINVVFRKKTEPHDSNCQDCQITLHKTPASESILILL